MNEGKKGGGPTAPLSANREKEKRTMTTDLAAYAAERGVKYFMISFTDLFGGQRAKLVPAQAIGDMQHEGAGFAGFATRLDMTPAPRDVLRRLIAEAASEGLHAKTGIEAEYFLLTPEGDAISDSLDTAEKPCY